MTAHLEIDFTRVVWRAAGAGWGHTFLCLPAEHAVASDRWVDLLAEAQPNVSSTRVDDPVAGWIDGSIPYIAARVSDPDVRDRFDRRLEHHILVLPRELPTELPAEWGTKLLRQLRELRLLSDSMRAPDAGAAKDDLARLRTSSTRIAVSGEPGPFEPRDIGRSRFPRSIAIVGAVIMLLATMFWFLRHHV